MQFAQPWLLMAGVVGAALITALHFLSVRTPPELLLPTARFLDEGEVRAVSRSARPSDLLLLLLRIAALLLAAIALAGPRWVPARSERLELIVADASWRRDSATLVRALGLSSGQAAASTITRFVWSDSLDSHGQPAGLRTDVAAAVPLALRAAAQQLALSPAVDSVALRVVLPSGSEAASLTADSAGVWRGWRGQWPGAIRLYGDSSRPVAVPVRLRFDSVRADDPVRAALALRGGNASSSASSSAPARLVVVQRQRGLAPARDSASVTIVWPSDGTPAGWTSAKDTADALVADSVALVGAWLRVARPPISDAKATRPIVWWNDGQAAATERVSGATCVRDVGVPLSASSDLLLDENARGMLRALLAPCATSASGLRSAPALLGVDTLGSSRAAAASALRASESDATASRVLTIGLLVAALLLLLAETFVRTRNGDGESATAARARREVTAA